MGLVLAGALLGAPAAFARDGEITSFDGTRIELSYFPAEGLAAGAKAPTVLFGPGWSSGRTTDPDSVTDTDRRRHRRRPAAQRPATTC